MKIFYNGRKGGWNNDPVPSGKGNRLELLWNDWDDYGYATTFPISCRIDRKDIELGSVKILIEGRNSSRAALNELLKEGWNGEFPIPDANYLSVPNEVTFYQQLMSQLGEEAARDIAVKLRDASFFVKIQQDPKAIVLADSEGFHNSLQRERGSMKAYEDGAKVFQHEELKVSDFSFSFLGQREENVKVNFKFSEEDSILPRDINVLIGPNGIGKSQLLHKIVGEWLDPKQDESNKFEPRPSLSQLVVVSYSPFEIFPVDLTGKEISDDNIYRYFGFRGRSPTNTESSRKVGRIRLAHTFPKKNAAIALLECLENDQRFQSVPEWGGKLETLASVVLSAFEFDDAAVRLDGVTDLDEISQGSRLLLRKIRALSEGEAEGRYFVPLAAKYLAKMNADFVRKHISADEGIIFFRDGKQIRLSSGQRLFAYIVINILGAIRRNSLIVVDEPELFLHPTLEIQFVSMLKTVLKRFSSKAVLATHSVVTVREVPEDCVHVFQRDETGELHLVKPPFQTFGGDHQRISSYVFGDNSVSKPFEEWIDEKLKKYGSAEALLERLSGQLNEEITIDILAKARDIG